MARLCDRCAGSHPHRGLAVSPEPEELDLLDWEDWFAVFETRQLKFVYDPTNAWIDLQVRNVRPD